MASSFINKFGVRKALLVSGLLCAAGLFLGAFATNIFIIYVSFGVLNGMVNIIIASLVVSYLIFVGALVFEFLAAPLNQILTTQDTFVRCPEAHTKIFQRTNMAILQKTLLGIADFWKKLTQHPELMYLTGGEATN